MTVAEPTVEVLLDAEVWQQEVAAAALRTLSESPPTLDPVWFYDERGSNLFDDITRLPEYYLTRAERALLHEHAGDLAGLGVDTFVELGSGTCDKTTTVLDALVPAGLRRYVPFDVSDETLRASVSRLSQTYPTLELHGIVGDFHHHLGSVPDDGRRLVALLGSTLGNLNPDQRQRFLVDLDATLDRADHLLLGVDLVKGEQRLVDAYDDAAGVTAEFNLNALRVLNDRLGTNFEPSAFEHVARWQPDGQWMQMSLRSVLDQSVVLPGLESTLELAAGEEIRTEISAKFEVDAFTKELWECGFVVDEAWTAPGDDFALVLAHPYC